MKTITILSVLSVFLMSAVPSEAAYRFSDFQGRPPIHIYASTGAVPRGMTPDQIKTAYGLPKTGGHGTIAIIDAYDDRTVESDLAIFDAQFHLPACTTANGCFEKHKMSGVEGSGGWTDETALDVEWAHAIAPEAKILLVEAETQSGANLLKAVDYASARSDVVAISMSWGSNETSDEATLDSHLVSKSGAIYFAASGDDGTGVIWPASSPNVVAVGGTTLALNANGTVKSETAWKGSGGGISKYEKQPAYQAGYSIPKAGGMRAIPDVAYNADPKSGYSIVLRGKWETIGGTSAGTPQWAAIASLGSGVTNPHFYADKASANPSNYFHDITSGTNGPCGYLCTARRHYDYVTGLGSPRTTKF